MTTKQKLLLVGSLLMILTGCVTSKQIEDIVNNSNAAIVSQQMLNEVTLPMDGGTVQPGSGADAPDKIEAAIQRISAFETTHSDNPGLVKTINALKLRKGLLYMMQGKFNLADRAFSEFKVDLAGSQRDKTIHRAHDVLIWWWQANGPQANPKNDDYDKALGSLNALLEDVSTQSDIGLYLHTMYAHIWIARYSREINPSNCQQEEEHDCVQKEAARFTAVFDENDQANILIWIRDQQASLPDSFNLQKIRWYGHAAIVRDELLKLHRRAVACGEASADIEWPEATRWLMESENELGEIACE